MRPRQSTLWLVTLVSLLFGALPPAGKAAADERSAASWQTLFASESDSVVFLGEDGAMWRAPFHLAACDTLWRPRRHDERVRRFLVSPDGRSVAWLSARDDADSTYLWVADARSARVLAGFRRLRPSDFDMEYYEPVVPSIEDPVVRGGRLIRCGMKMLGRRSHALAWTADGASVVWGTDGELLHTRAEQALPRPVSPMRAAELRLLEPSPFWIMRSIEGGKGNSVLSDRLLEPTGRPIAVRGLSLDRTWTASRTTVWWVDGRQIRSIRVFDPTPAVEHAATDPIVWLEYDPARRVLEWAAGARVMRRADFETDAKTVLTASAPIRRVIGISTGGARGLIAGDSLLVWRRGDDSVRGVMLDGLMPFALFEAPSGECAVASGSLGVKARMPQVVLSIPGGAMTLNPFSLVPALYQVASLHRLDFGAGRLENTHAPRLENGHCFPSPSGSYVLLVKTLPWRPGPVRAFDIETKQWKEFRRPSEAASLKLKGSEAPDPQLHVYDLKSGTWTAIANPGVAAWEPLGP